MNNASVVANSPNLEEYINAMTVNWNSERRLQQVRTYTVCC